MKAKNIFLLVGIFLGSFTVRANYVSFPDSFAADGDCYGGWVNFNGATIFHKGFPGFACGDCCGKEPVRTSIHEYSKAGFPVRCVLWDRLGHNDDIAVGAWFIYVAGIWAHTGLKWDCYPGSMP